MSGLDSENIAAYQAPWFRGMPRNRDWPACEVDVKVLSLLSQHGDNGVKSCFGYVTRWDFGYFDDASSPPTASAPCCNDRARCTFPYTVRPCIVLASQTIKATSSHLCHDQSFVRILHNFLYECLLLYKLLHPALIMLNRNSIRGKIGPA